METQGTGEDFGYAWETIALIWSAVKLVMHNPHRARMEEVSRDRWSTRLVRLQVHRGAGHTIAIPEIIKKLPLYDIKNARIAVTSVNTPSLKVLQTHLRQFEVKIAEPYLEGDTPRFKKAMIAPGENKVFLATPQQMQGTRADVLIADNANRLTDRDMAILRSVVPEPELVLLLG